MAKDSGVMAQSYEVGNHSSPWNPRTWSRRVWTILITAIVVIVIVVVATVVGVNATRNNNNGPSGPDPNRYPNYTRLDYTLADTCELTVK
jgi:heme/copper-type cytochrome/quinol oxidase subunit 2